LANTIYQGDTGPCLNPTIPTWLGSTGSQTGGKFPPYTSTDVNNCNVSINGIYALTIPGQPGYNSFLDTLLDACEQIPGVCSQMQEYMCYNCDRQQIIANPYLTKFCGCSSVPGTEAGNPFYNSTLQNFDPTCDPICNRIGTIKQVNPANGTIKQCNASVCVIDSVGINSIASTGVVPTFDQVCPSCADGQGNCICVIDATFDSTIPSIRGTADGQALDNAASFTQYCPNSQCFVTNPMTGEYLEVKCSDRLPKSPNQVKIPWWVWLIAGIILVVGILIVLSYKYQSDNIPIYLLSSQYIKPPPPPPINPLFVQ
jgi:hypothetical protein